MQARGARIELSRDTKITVETDGLAFELEPKSKEYELIEEGANEGFYIEVN